MAKSLEPVPVKDQVSRNLLSDKISEIYGYNKSISNAIDYSMPTLVEAGFIDRPKPGVYEKPQLEPSMSISARIYIESFFVNNPLLSRDSEYLEGAYFEFLR